jgi:ribosomal protein L7/L12
MTISNYALAFFLALNAVAFFFSHSRRIQEVERKLNLVLTHLGIDPTAQVDRSALASPSSHVMSLAADPRRRIDAIKAYREQTGADLKTAMQVVDSVAASAKGVEA